MAERVIGQRITASKGLMIGAKHRRDNEKPSRSVGHERGLGNSSAIA
jgi:hypothetical protein